MQACVAGPATGPALLRLAPGCSSSASARSARFTSGRPLLGRAGAPPSNGCRWSASWVDNTATVRVEVPITEAWEMWQVKEDIPKWMPWISSVKSDPTDRHISRWTLSTVQFGRTFEFSWTARDLAPLPLQKIHWASSDGLQNRGAVRFVKKGDAACEVALAISYEIPDVLVPFGTAVTPLVESIIQADLKRFAAHALSPAAADAKARAAAAAASR